MLQKNEKIRVRNSSIELLRIIAMVMIVFHHFSYHGGFSYGASVSVNHFWYNFIVMGGKIGVDIFVLISGYNLITDHGTLFNVPKIVKFLGQVLFYSVAFFFVGIMTGVLDFGAKTALKAFFPITFSAWWFASTYFVLYLMHPFINKLLTGIDRSMYQKLILLLVVCWSIIPTFTISSFQSNSLLWFVTLYAIAGYVKLYGLNKNITTKHYAVIWGICSLLTYASSVVFTILGNKWEIFAKQATYFYGQEKITTLLISVSFFMIFETAQMKYHKWINTVASATFGVYLIHDHGVVSDFLWKDLFENARYQDSAFLIPYSIFVVAVVFIACACIDLLRQSVVEKPFMRLVKRCSGKKIVPLEKIGVFLKDLIFGKEA